MGDTCDGVDWGLIEIRGTPTPRSACPKAKTCVCMELAGYYLVENEPNQHVYGCDWHLIFQILLYPPHILYLILSYDAERLRSDQDVHCMHHYCVTSIICLLKDYESNIGACW